MPDPIPDIFYKDASFKATHNSYSGNIRAFENIPIIENKGVRGSIIQQLDSGVRLLEFDIHSETGAFLLGHGWKGHEVAHDRGNPESNLLEDWFKIIADWSAKNPNHIPITIVLDVKENIDNTATGNLADLNDFIQDKFEQRLFCRKDYDADAPPKVADLCGRILVVLSGDKTNRKAYHNSAVYEQRMFLEYQKDDGSDLDEIKDSLFYATNASDKNYDWATENREHGKIIRLWKYNKDKSIAINFPATDTPYWGRYLRPCEHIGTIPQFPGIPLEWGADHNFDKGVSPSVALNNSNLTVEVHQSDAHETLWYHVGTANSSNKKVSWGRSHQYDKGRNPAIAINNAKIAVEVHMSDAYDTLWYHVGQINDGKKTIDWGKSYQYDKGVNPAVTLNDDGVLVEVHQSEDEETLWYHVGKVNIANKTIEWGESIQYDTGVTPQAALNNAGLILEAHKSENEDRLWCKIGRINPELKRIDWAQNHQYQYDTGKSPNIGLNEQFAVEVHKSENKDTLWHHMGVVSGTLMAWNGSRNYDNGVSPAIAINDSGLLIEVHQSKDHKTLWYQVIEWRKDIV